MFISATINEITREIKWDKSQVAAVDGDYAVNGFKLNCLGLDPDYNLTTGTWYAVFTDQNGTSHSNPLTVSGGVVTWEFDNNINKGGSGVIKFFLYAVTTNAAGKVLKRWDSAITDLRVAGTIDYENQEEEAARESEIDRLAGLVTTLTATAATINDVKAVLARITNSSPVVVATAADLSGLDTTKYQLAIVRADGYLYYYDGTEWQQGIKYGSYELDATLTESGKAADAAAVGAKILQIKEDLSAQAAEVAQTKDDVSAISEKTDETIILDNTSFDRTTNNTTFSYDAATNTTTVTNTTASRYRCANTPLSFLHGKLIPGETYILSGQATAISGSPTLRIAIRGTESATDSTAASLDLVSGVPGEVSFVATEYMRYVSLFATYDNTDLSSAAYKDVYIKSEAEGVTAVDVMAREGIKDIREQISGLNITNQWSGKTWYAYGTSITHNTVSGGKYVGYLAEMGGFAEAVRKGIPGQGIGNLGDYSTGQVYDAICNTTDGKLTADLITLETGANDLGHVTVPLGTVYDTGQTTLAGCLNDCLRYLQANTNAQVAVFFSPATTFAPTANYQFYEWQEMVQKICDINRVHYIKVNCNLGYGKLTSGKGSLYVTDSIHQTDLGAYIYAENIWRQLKNIPIFRTELPT